jgi:histidinol-phosphate aminotransferase
MKKKDILRLDLNERLAPPEVAVVEALHKQTERVNHYVRAEDCQPVKKLIAQAHKVKPENIVLFNGSWHGLMTVASFLFHEKDEVVVPVPTFPFYLEFARQKQFKVKKVSGLPQNLTADKIIKSFTPKTRGLYLVNPTNPFGELISEGEIKNILDEASRRQILVILDEAYGDLIEADNAVLIKKYHNLIISRSGSKTYGLGGIRAGYLIAEKKLAETLRSCRGPSYTLSVLSLASLEAFYTQKEPLASYVAEIKFVREELKKLLREKGLAYFDSQANFLTFRVLDAEKFCRDLEKDSILVKDLSDYPDGGKTTKNLVRITIPHKKHWPRLKRSVASAIG